MKKTINGTTYNTETSTLIDSRENMPNQSDLYYCKESLYQTQKGKFFILFDGGACSIAAHKDSLGGFVGGKLIVPVSDDNRNKWNDEGGFYFFSQYMDGDF